MNPKRVRTSVACFFGAGRIADEQCLSCHILLIRILVDALRRRWLGGSRFCSASSAGLVVSGLEPHDVLGARTQRIDEPWVSRSRSARDSFALKARAREELAEDRNVHEQRNARLDALVLAELNRPESTRLVFRRTSTVLSMRRVRSAGIRKP